MIEKPEDHALLLLEIFWMLFGQYCQIHTETLDSRHWLSDRVSVLLPLSHKLSTLGHELYD